MIALYFVLLLLAAICFALATFTVRSPVNLVALGLFFFGLVPFVKVLLHL